MDCMLSVHSTKKGNEYLGGTIAENYSNTIDHKL